MQGQASALTAIALVNMDHDERGQAHALSNLGHLHELQGELELSEEESSAAVQLLEKLGHTQGLAHALDNRGVTRQRLGLLDEAMADHESARDLAVQLGDRLLEGYALNNVASTHRQSGNLAAAFKVHERAREVADLAGNPALRIQLYLDRGATCFAAGEPEKARQNYLAALDLAIARGDLSGKAHADHGAARVLHSLGRHDEAAPHWRDAEVALNDLRLPEAAWLRKERAELSCACGHPRSGMPAGTRSVDPAVTPAQR